MGSEITSILNRSKAIIFDFYRTLVIVDRDAPEMWQTLSQIGYYCPPELQAIWESDAFDGFITPCLQNNPSYKEWRRENIKVMVKMCGVPSNNVIEVVNFLLSLDKLWTVKALPFAI